MLMSKHYIFTCKCFNDKPDCTNFSKEVKQRVAVEKHMNLVHAGESKYVVFTVVPVLSTDQSQRKGTKRTNYMRMCEHKYVCVRVCACVGVRACVWVWVDDIERERKRERERV